MSSRAEVEAVVIGAGVVGVAIARGLAMRGVETVVVERCALAGQGISSRNSEVVHAGFYYEKDSLKERLCLAGKAMLYDYCQEKEVACKKVGKLLVATADDQLDGLRALETNARRASVEMHRLTREEAERLEPEVQCVEALFSPTTGVVDSHGFLQALLADAEANGAVVAYRSRVMRADIDDDEKTVLEIMDEEDKETTRLVATKIAVNAAGLYAANLVRSKLSFAKGNYFSCKRRPFTHLVYPLPDPRGGLGVHATVGLDGSVKFGPDLEFLHENIHPDDIDYTVDKQRAPSFYDAIRRYYPGLQNGDLQPDYSGVRPKLLHYKDFNIVRHHRTFVSLLGIESPGLTASMAIADNLINNYCEL